MRSVCPKLFPIFLPLFLVSTPAIRAQDCCAETYRIVYKTIEEYVPVTVRRPVSRVVETEEEVTVMKPVEETSKRTRTKIVRRRVPETSTRVERQTVMRPEYESSERLETREVTEWETEERVERERYTVSRPVYETDYREQRYRVRRPVTETTYQDQNYVAYEPVTTYRTSYVDQGGYVDSLNYQSGGYRNRLTFLRGGYAPDPVSGVTRYYRGGLSWVPYERPGSYQVNRQYVPNITPVQVPQTEMVGRTYTQRIPVQSTRYVDDIVSEQVPVERVRYEQEERVRERPYTVTRPITRTVTERVPVERVRYRPHVIEREVPVTTYKIVEEEIEEPYTVRTLKYVPEKQTRKVQKVVADIEEKQMYRKVIRTVAMRVPLDASYDYPSETVIDGPIYSRPADKEYIEVVPGSGAEAEKAPTLEKSSIEKREQRKRPLEPAPNDKEKADKKIDLNGPENAGGNDKQARRFTPPRR